MAVLETIRTKIGWLISALIFIALLSFIVDFNSLSSALNSTSSKYAVGKIDGKKIPYKDFQEQVEYQTSIAEIATGNVSSDEQHQQIRNAAWQHFINQNLFLKNAKAAGIEVGKDEIAQLLGGQEQFVNLLQNMDADPTGNIRKYVEYIQNGTFDQQFYVKYLSLFAESDVCNDLALANTMAANNVSANAQVVMYPYGYAKDTTITVSSSEIKKYYNAHKDMFKQVANRDIEYALFEVTPSADDLAAAGAAIADVYDEFCNTTNMKAFLMRNSEKSLSNYYYKAGELNTVNKEVNDFVFGSAKGVSPIYNSGNEYFAVTVVDTKDIPDNVRVKHILSSAEVIDSLSTVIGGSFAKFNEVLEQYTAVEDPQVQAGEVGTLSQSQMIPGMEEVLTAPVNKPFVLTTQYGKHIVVVTERNNVLPRKKVAILQKTAIPSKATMNEAYSKANTLATAAAGSLEKLQAAAKEQNVYLRPLNVNEATARYSAVDKAKEVTRWVFDAKKGAASTVITVNQNYLFVVGVKDTHKEGHATVKEAASRIENILYNEKKADKVLAEVKEKIAGATTIEAVAEALDKQVSTNNDVTFAAARQAEPALVGAIAGTEKGQLSAPVKGIMGVYVVYVTDRNEGAFFTADDAKAQYAQKAQYMSQMVVPAMIDATNTVDNRERFF